MSKARVLSSLRSRLTLALLGLGTLAPLVTAWEANSWATEALTDASHSKLATLRETRRRHIERWFADVSAHARVMSTHESTISALEQFSKAWSTIPGLTSAQSLQLGDWYGRQPSGWRANEPHVQSLHFQFLVQAPVEGPDLQLSAERLGEYGRVHAKHHAGLRSYQATFGFYDLLLVDSGGRVLYTVRKEPDIGAHLREEPFRNTALARAFERALKAEDRSSVIEDFSFYSASRAPAAFVAAPIKRAGLTIGALVMQLSIDEINRVMTGDRQWRADGLGATGHAYMVGADGRYRSDVRTLLEQPEQFVARLQQTHGAQTSQRVQKDHTEVLHLTVNHELREALGTGRTQTYQGTDFFERPVLRSLAPLKVPGLDWWVVAEESLDESFEPVQHLRQRMIVWSGLFAGVVMLVAWLLSRMVTVPVRALRDGVRQIADHAFATRVNVSGRDELAELALAFNEMAGRLEKTTVSRDDLERLAARLIEAQEEERRRIARELHDDLGQRFAALSMDLTQLAHLNRSGEKAPDLLERVRAGLLAIANEVRHLSRSLHPSVLDDLGLIAALESECRLFNERGLPVELVHRGNLDDLDRATQLTLYRIVQEGLHNIVKHARASVAVVSLTRSDRVSLSIVDDGQGFDVGPPSARGLGLASMKERTRLLGGSFVISSEAGQGTRIEVSLPVRQS